MRGVNAERYDGEALHYRMKDTFAGKELLE
jgi:hypothetical protein